MKRGRANGVGCFQKAKNYKQSNPEIRLDQKKPVGCFLPNPHGLSLEWLTGPGDSKYRRAQLDLWLVRLVKKQKKSQK